jgi:signal transduction histidine kinase
MQVTDESEKSYMTNGVSHPSASPKQDRSEAKLRALTDAALAITAELNLDTVLSRLAEIAANLVGVKYAALGVPDGKGGLSRFLTYGMSEDEISHMDHYPLGRGLLGLLVRRPEPIRLEHMEADERSAGLPANHPEMHSFLGVPILSKGKILGSLYLCEKQDGTPFDEDDEHVVGLLAAHAAIAIENAMLVSQLKKLTIIEERDRISMELHDGIIQSIYALGIKLDLARLSLADKPEVQNQVLGVTRDLNHVIEDLRRYIQDLRTVVDYTVALHEKLDEIAQGFRQVCQARLIIDVARGFAQLSDAHLHAIVQMTREALSNIARHAEATEVYVDIHETSSHIALVVSDNGKGFDPKQDTKGNGLRNLRQRARLLNGTVDIISQPGRGTTVTVLLPPDSKVNIP